MVKKPTYEELEQRIKELEEEAIKRNRAEEEASYELYLMQTLLNNIPEYIYFKDRERKFVRVSNQFCDLFKCNMEDIIGKKDEGLFPEEVAKETVKDDRHVIETGIPIINKVEGGESISGKEHWVLTTKLPWRDKEGNIIGLFGISKEITERKRTEEALRKSEERYRYLSESSPIGVFETDKNGSVQFLNNKWLTITGMSRQNALEFGWAEALHSADRPRILEEWARIEGSGHAK
jgi:PAS domain S-box-containing protein